MLDLTYAQAVERIDDVLSRYFPKELRTREVRVIVVHSPYADETFAELRAFTTRGVYGKQRAVRYRHGSLMALPFALVPHVPDHETGRCGVCTLRYRQQQGLGLDVSDLPHQLGYAPASQVEATRRWTREELAKVPARRILK